MILLFLWRAEQTVSTSGGLFPRRSSSAASLEYLRQHDGFTSGWVVMRCDVRLAPPDRLLSLRHPRVPRRIRRQSRLFFFPCLSCLCCGFFRGRPCVTHTHTRTKPPSSTLRVFRTAAKNPKHVKTLRPFWSQTFFIHLLTASSSLLLLISSARSDCFRLPFIHTNLGVQAAVNKTESLNHLIYFSFFLSRLVFVLLLPHSFILFIIGPSPRSALPSLASSSSSPSSCSTPIHPFYFLDATLPTFPACRTLFHPPYFPST